MQMTLEMGCLRLRRKPAKAPSSAMHGSEGELPLRRSIEPRLLMDAFTGKKC